MKRLKDKRSKEKEINIKIELDKKNGHKMKINLQYHKKAKNRISRETNHLKSIVKIHHSIFFAQ